MSQQVVSLFEDSTFGLDLEKIRAKILTLYNSLLAQAFKAENPGASPEELQAFLDENALEFPEVEDNNEEVDALLELMDSIGDDLSPVDKDAPSPKVEQGKEPKFRSHESGDTPADQRVKKRTRSLEDPTGTQKRSKTHERPNVTGMAPLVKQIQDTLVDLRQRQTIGRKYMEDRL